MKLPSLILLCALSLVHVEAADVNPNDDMQRAHHFKKSHKVDLEAHYWLFLPKTYRTEETKRWPLMLFLHGAGERGTNLNAVRVHGPPKLVRSQPDFPFVLVSPQCPSGQRWNTDVLLGLLDQLIEEYRVDTNRIYVTGLSMGGYGTWALAAAAPQRFAAMAPICGGGNTVELLLPNRGNGRALRELPIWAFHGAKDTVVKPIESERMVEALKRLGNQNVKLTIYPEADHDSWTETYANPELYEWMLQHKLGE